MKPVLPKNFFNSNKSFNLSFDLKEKDLDYYNCLFKEYEKLYMKEIGINSMGSFGLKDKALQKKQILNQPVKKSLLEQSSNNKRYKN